MSMVKEMLFLKNEELAGEIHEDAFLAFVHEMEQIQNDHTLANYVILKGGKRCYLRDACDPFTNKCEC